MTPAERYAYYKARGRCVQCHERDAFTLAGRAYCAACIERQHAYEKKYRSTPLGDARKARVRQRTADRKAQGLCTRCGKPLPPGSPYVTCDKHRAAARIAKRKQTEARTGYPTGQTGERWQDGKCVKCGRPAAGVNSRGEPLRLCPAYYENALRGLEKAAANRKEARAHPWTKQNAIAFASTAKSSPRSIS